jgi:hypothetical protein
MNIIKYEDIIVGKNYKVGAFNNNSCYAIEDSLDAPLTVLSKREEGTYKPIKIIMLNGETGWCSPNELKEY